MTDRDARTTAHVELDMIITADTMIGVTGRCPAPKGLHAEYCDEDDDHYRVISIGERAAELAAERIVEGLDLDERRQHAEDVLRDRLAAEAARLVADALTTRRDKLAEASRQTMTLAQLIVAEVQRQLTHPSPTASARGRMNVPVIDAIVAAEVTESLRTLTGEQVAEIRAKILADIASTGGRG